MLTICSLSPQTSQVPFLSLEATTSPANCLCQPSSPCTSAFIQQLLDLTVARMRLREQASSLLGASISGGQSRSPSFPGPPALRVQWPLPGGDEAPGGHQASQPPRGAAHTSLIQETPVHVTHPQQGEPAREVEDARPAVPVQEQGAHSPSHQRTAKTAGVARTLASQGPELPLGPHLV